MTKFEQLGMLVAMAGTGVIAGTSVMYLRPVGPPGASAVTVSQVRDVRWFKSHIDEMNSKFQACMNNPGMGQLDPECPNVFAAKQSSDIDTMLALMPNGGK